MGNSPCLSGDNPQPSPTCKAWPLLGVLVPAPLHQVEHLVALAGPVVPDQLQPRPLPRCHLHDDGHHVGPWGKAAHSGCLPWEKGWDKPSAGAGLVFTCVRFLLHEHLPDDDAEAAGEESCEHLDKKCTYCFCLLEKRGDQEGSSSGGKDFIPQSRRISSPRPKGSGIVILPHFSLSSGVTKGSVHE